MSNVTVTISNGSIRVQGNVTYGKTTGDYAQIIIKSSVSQTAGIAYTVACFGGSCNMTNYAFGPYMATSSTIIYNNPIENESPSLDNPAVTVRIKSSDSIYHGALTIYDINAENPTAAVDVTFGVGALYEGEFKNPPYHSSLDVKPSNQFALSNREYPNGYLQYQSSPIAMYNKAQWGAANAVSFFEHKIHALFNKGTGTKKLVFHKTEIGSGNNDNSILIGRFAITYTTTNSSQRGYGYAYDFYYQIFGISETVAALNGKLTELYKASGLSAVPSIGYSLSSGKIYDLYLEFPDNVTDWGGKVFLEYTIVSDYGRNGTATNYSFRQPYYI